MSVQRSELSVERSAPRAGGEVWLDQDGGLVGGDAWDAKIRGQIASCALFVPVISANTQARREGYFRLEWKLAAQRTHMMSERTAFLLPVVIDSTRDAEADVPAEFRAVQWTRLAGGDATEAFCTRVKALLGGGDALSTRSGSMAEASHARSRETSPPNRFRPIALVIVLAAAGVALVVWQPWKTAAPSPAPGVAAATPDAPLVPAYDPKSVAVLAFANMSADKAATEYFSDGISEEILNALDRIPSLRVTPRTSSFSFKDKNVALHEIGRALRVASVIEGSVRKVDNQVHIIVKLFNAADGTRIWSEEFKREMTDIFALQAEVAGKIAQRLGGAPLASSTRETPRAPTANLAAYDLYLRARAQQMGSQTATARLATAKLYEDAVDRDPNYALAWARLAQVLAEVFVGGFDRNESLGTRAATAAATAL